QYGKVIGLSPWPSLNNSSDQIVLKSFKNRTVDSVSYSDTWYKDAGKKQGGWTLERMAESPCIGWYNWDASYDLSGGTPGKINSSNNRGSKNLNLKIDSILVISESTLRVYFNTIQDTVFLRPNNFKLNGIQALSVKTSEKFLSIELTFKDHFIEGTTYTLITQELRTCSGSLITQPDNQITFTTPAIPELNYPIVINEIFADPSPVVGMPEAEFVELFNPTDKTIALKGLIYEDALTKYVFPSGRIEPGGYLILCALKDTLSFKPFGNVYGLANWPSLNNDKDILTLRNNKGKAISSINYESGWHRDKNKQSGGWSLELIDLNAVCSGKQNWSSSTHTSGGTPGKQNSIYKTNFSNEALKLSTGFLIDSVTLQLTFNRTIDSLSASRVTNYSLNNGIGKPMQATVLDPDFTQVNLKFQNALIRRNTYKISVTDVTDCAGISISANNNSKEFFFPKRLEKGDILINEILFNPRKNGADFVEIYNNSANNFDLKDLAIATYKDSLTSIKPLSLLTQLIKSGEYLVLTTDPDNIKKEYVIEKPDAFLKMQSMPAFNDDAGVIVLLSHGIRIDELIYTDKMHYKLIKDPEGVSLERSSFSKATNEPDNFRSATASAGYATPGYKNSQFIEEVISEEEVFLSSKTFSPDSDGFEDVLTLNYKFNEPGWIANVTIYNDKGVLIKKLTKNHSLAANGTIYWDGLNEFNEKPPVGIYVLYMEVFNLQGKVKKYRRSFVLAAKLN
ncbi:MAG TPA: lamin tail domain-containing protein, partial [Sphingobacteriaceae bacterium]|nr:lamin tail domain-containing protein [Sphingobacteriaceae bacterium]